MSLFQIKHPDVESFVLEKLGTDLLVPKASPNSDEAVYFQNGDKMTINLKTGMLLWEPMTPGKMFTSRLSMRLHQWFGKGWLKPLREEPNG